MIKVVTFGEIMLRLAPNGYYRIFRMTRTRQRLEAEKPMQQHLLLTFRWIRHL